MDLGHGDHPPGMVLPQRDVDLEIALVDLSPHVLPRVQIRVLGRHLAVESGD